jgi:hypothetical protein
MTPTEERRLILSSAGVRCQDRETITQSADISADVCPHLLEGSADVTCVSSQSAWGSLPAWALLGMCRKGNAIRWRAREPFGNTVFHDRGDY